MRRYPHDWMLLLLTMIIFKKSRLKLAFGFKVKTSHFKLKRMNTFNSICFDKYKSLINVWFLGFNLLLRFYFFSLEAKMREFLLQSSFLISFSDKSWLLYSFFILWVNIGNIVVSQTELYWNRTQMDNTLANPHLTGVFVRLVTI